MPFVGSLLNVGVMFLALAIAIPLSLLVIALAWLFYRPLLGIGLLLLAAAVIAGVVFFVRSRQNKAGPATAGQTP